MIDSGGDLQSWTFHRTYGEGTWSTVNDTHVHIIVNEIGNPGNVMLDGGYKKNGDTFTISEHKLKRILT